MKVAVRTDAGQHMGTGHVMRTLTLAKALRRKGRDVTFYCRPHKGNLVDFIRAEGFDVTVFGAGVMGFPRPDPADRPFHKSWLGGDWYEDVAAIPSSDLLVVDHYALDEGFEQAMRAKTRRICVIDDLADRAHDADLLLDQGFGRRISDYEGLGVKHCLAGTNYALLRPEFVTLRAEALSRRERFKTLSHVLVTMGGADAQNVTAQIIPYLETVPKVTVVMGGAAPHLEHVRSLVAGYPNMDLLVDTPDLAQLMVMADLAIGAVGATSWERCCLGLPTLALVMAENQKAAAGKLADAGALRIMGNDGARDIEAFLKLLPDDYAEMSRAAADICDGRGLSRVMAEIGRLF